MKLSEMIDIISDYADDPNIVPDEIAKQDTLEGTMAALFRYRAEHYNDENTLNGTIPAWAILVALQRAGFNTLQKFSKIVSDNSIIDVGRSKTGESFNFMDVKNPVAIEIDKKFDIIIPNNVSISEIEFPNSVTRSSGVPVRLIFADGYNKPIPDIAIQNLPGIISEVVMPDSYLDFPDLAFSRHQNGDNEIAVNMHKGEQTCAKIDADFFKRSGHWIGG